jgi:hypothetical protein
MVMAPADRPGGEEGAQLCSGRSADAKAWRRTTGPGGQQDAPIFPILSFDKLR